MTTAVGLLIKMILRLEKEEDIIRKTSIEIFYQRINLEDMLIKEFEIEFKYLTGTLNLAETKKKILENYIDHADLIPIEIKDSVFATIK